jgi:hypothetical protein
MLIRIGALALVLATGVSGETLGVCDVLSNLSALNGKHVTVRGVWRQSHTGWALVSDAPCPKPTVVDGWRFWDGIELVREHGVVKGKFYRGLARKGVPTKDFAEFSGLLETREHFRVKTFPSGERTPDAFRYSAAQIIFTGDAQKIDRAPRPGYENDEELKRWGNPMPQRVDHR